MELPPGFLLKIAKATRSLEERPGMMSIIIRRPYSHLEKELCKTFEGQEDVRVIVDRRHGERRTNIVPVEMEHRRTNRRNPKEELVEVFISA
jgi:hypothetical protein